MKIDHIAMYVNDLEKAKEFFIQYFGATSNQMYHNTKTGFQSYFIVIDDGSRIELMTRPDVADKQKELLQTGYIHIAFSLGSREAVDSLTERLRNDGYAVVSGPRVTGDGYYESCIRGFEDNLIELTE
ncbi:MAG: VOC family protein [Eubacterium sp.]|nr:VOC family protein [Eubacterium sp.]